MEQEELRYVEVRARIAAGGARRVEGAREAGSAAKEGEGEGAAGGHDEEQMEEQQEQKEVQEADQEKQEKEQKEE